MSEWGPWIEHDGKGCPCVGSYVRVETKGKIGGFAAGLFGRIINDRTAEYIPNNKNAGSWTWKHGDAHVVRYRIRKPKGLTILTDILREVENTKQPEYTN